MIDYSLYGLNENDVDEYRTQICCLIGKSVIQVLSSNKPISKQNLISYLLHEVERQSDDYFHKLYRAAIEVIGVNGR